MVSAKLKIAAAFVVGMLLVASYIAVTQGTSDANAKQLLKENLETQRRVEAARVERVRQINRINQAQCLSLRNLYRIIRTTIEASDHNVEKLSYYRAHPGEAAFVHRQNRKTIAMFRQPPCPRDIKLPIHPIKVTER